MSADQKRPRRAIFSWTDGVSLAFAILLAAFAEFRGLPLPVTLLVALAVFAVSRWALGQYDGRRKVAEGVTEYDVDRILGLLKTRISEVQSFRIEDPAANAKVAEVVKALRDILAYLQEHEEYTPLVREFLEIYLEKSVEILRSYVGAQAMDTPKALEVRRLTEELYLPSLVDLSNKQKSDLYDLSLAELQAGVMTQAKLIDVQRLGVYGRTYERPSGTEGGPA